MDQPKNNNDRILPQRSVTWGRQRIIQTMTQNSKEEERHQSSKEGKWCKIQLPTHGRPCRMLRQGCRIGEQRHQWVSIAMSVPSTTVQILQWKGHLDLDKSTTCSSWECWLTNNETVKLKPDRSDIPLWRALVQKEKLSTSMKLQPD